VFDRSVVCSWECLHVKRGRGKTVTEFQFQFVTVTLLFVCFSFEETEERASCTRVEEASDMQARRNDTVWGPLSPQKPTRRRFGDQLSHQITHVGPAFFLSFFFLLVSFFILILVWFKWINGFGLLFLAC
jgi:hypothetical protein